VSKADLKIRDQVINIIKNKFYEAFDKEQIKVTGEVLISAFGSSSNGLWNKEKSDIDITAVFFD
jgi:hypothetical protein